MFFRSIFLLHFTLTVSGQNITIKPYLQNAKSGEITIMWETDDNGTGQVLWGSTPLNLDQSINSSSITGTNTSQIHTARIAPLLPKTIYYYKIQMTGGQSTSIYSFKTLDSNLSEASIQLIAISDTQFDGNFPNKLNEIIEQGIIPIVYQETGGTLNELEGLLIPGDLVTYGGDYSQWKDHFFKPAENLFPYVPVYPAAGNHDYETGGLVNFKKYFLLPENGANNLLEECWYKDMSNLRIIGMNSNSGIDAQNLQLAWLSEVLESASTAENIDFVFVELHHPYKSELWTPGENVFTGKVIDSLELFTATSHKATAHFFGHTHGYSRGQSRDHKHAWVNVATAGGAIDNWGEYPNADYEEFVKSQDEYGFVFIDVKAGDDPQFTLKRYSRGDQDITLNTILTDEITILNTDIEPVRPENVFPVGDTLDSNCLRLKASAFYGSEDSHQASHWQISLGENFLEGLVSEKWLQNENVYYDVDLQATDDLTDVSFEPLPGDTSYYWRVRYRNQNLTWSNWSETTSFFLANSVDTLSPNLIQNGGAEDGLSFWSGDIESLQNGECNSVQPFEGSYNFAVGGICQNEITIGRARQIIDLSPYSTAINSGLASADFGAYIRDYNGSDLPEIYIEFYNHDNLLLTSEVLSNQTGTWIFIHDIIPVPPESQYCLFWLKGTRNAGTDNDCYFDNIAFYLVNLVDCPDCYGRSGVDNDEDGFCNDMDCDDSNGQIFPGALEICDGLDNNCDGYADFGSSVSWTGYAGNDLWSDSGNWDQLFPPLPCQHVTIDHNANVIIDGTFECNSLELAASDTLNIQENSTLIINSQNNNSNSSAIIRGTMILHGVCQVFHSDHAGFEIYGTLINNNKLSTFDIESESVIIKPGGRLENNGKTNLN